LGFLVRPRARLCQLRQESSRSILKGNGELEDTGTKMGKIDRKQMYRDDFLFYGFKALNEVWIIDIKKQ
jgi:hypothetical protein